MLEERRCWGRGGVGGGKGAWDEGAPAYSGMETDSKNKTINGCQLAMREASMYIPFAHRHKYTHIPCAR